MGAGMVEREDINASIEMGLAQLMLELHSHDAFTLETRNILHQILDRLTDIEAKLDRQQVNVT